MWHNVVITDKLQFCANLLDSKSAACIQRGNDTSGVTEYCTKLDVT